MANIFQNIFRREATPVSGAEHPQQQAGASLPKQVVRVANMKAALRIPACLRAVTVIANTISVMPPRFERKMLQHGGNYEEVPFGKLNYLLQVQPNPIMTATDFWKRVAVDILCDGNAVAIIKRAGMYEDAFYLCQRALVAPNTMKYTVTYQTEFGQITETVDSADVLHFKNDHLKKDGIMGESTLVYAADALSLAATNSKRASDIASRGGDMRFIMSESGSTQQMGASKRLTQDQKATQKNRVQEQCDNNDQIILVSGQIDLRPLTDPTAIQILEGMRKMDVLEIARIFGVPPTALMDYTNNTYKAPEQGTQELLQRTILPRKIAIENELNAKLLGPAGFGKMRFYMDDRALMALDPIGRANLTKTYIETGVWCPNEARLQLNLPAIPTEEGGDRHLVSTNLQPLDDLKTGAQVPPTNTPKE